MPSLWRSASRWLPVIRTPRRLRTGTGPRDAEAAGAGGARDAEAACASTGGTGHTEAGCASRASRDAEVPGRLQVRLREHAALIAAQSNEGKAAAEKLKAFQDQKTRELQDKQKTLQAAQQKLESGGSVLSDGARAQLQTDIERQQRDLQRLTEDAQQDVQNLAQQVEEDFTRKVLPIIGKVAQEKQVHFVFNAAQSGLIWAEPGMDLTSEVIARHEAGGAKPAAAPTPPRPVRQIAQEARVPDSRPPIASSAASPIAIRRC